MAFPERFLDELVARSDLVDIAGGYTSLQQRGGRYWGLCPFHSEKTASFSVQRDAQLYYCFGCSKGGGVVNFVMEAENLSFPDAVRFLAKRAGMEVPEEEGEGEYRARRARLLALQKDAARFYHACLTEPRGAAALAYVEKRGLTPATVRRFGLGAAPDGWDNLLSAMVKQGYTKQELLDGGLVVVSQNGGVYDRFRSRLMFPIIDVRGDVVAFGGRVLDDGTPKYLNTSDTPIFSKRRTLFALNFAKRSRQGRIILAEGYMDAISMHQYGFDCAVAMLGTGCTDEHAQLLSRYTQEVVISGDTDGPGLAAVQRAIGVLEKTGMRVKVLRVPGAKDPDEFLRKNGAAAFSLLLDRSENHIEYRLLQIRGKYDLTADEGRIEFLKEAEGLVASLPSPVEREVYGARAAEAAGVSAEAVALEVARLRKRRAKEAQKKRERRDLAPAAALQPKERTLRYGDVRSAVAEEGVLRLVLLEPQLLEDTSALRPEDFSAPLLGKAFAALRDRYQDGRSVALAPLAETFDAAEMSHLALVLQKPESAAKAPQALEDYIATIREQALKRSVKEGDGALLAAWETYKKKKGYGGSEHE